MNHKKNLRKLNITSSHRKSMFNNMIISLFKNEFIKTTLKKAKEFRKIIEKIITISKKNNLSNRKLIFKKLRNKEIIKKIFLFYSNLFKDKNGGYTRIFKIGYRLGDKAPMALIIFSNNN